MISPELKKMLTQSLLGLPTWVWILAFYACLDLIAAHYAMAPTLPHSSHLHLPG